MMKPIYIRPVTEFICTQSQYLLSGSFKRGMHHGNAKQWMAAGESWDEDDETNSSGEGVGGGKETAWPKQTSLWDE